MRDDDAEPSDRGMAALMAAAREQADAMKPKESWWAKLFDQLRRPPVLAMATVVVLIGGAVVISSRGDEMKTETEMVSEPSATMTSDHRVDTPTPAPADDGLATGEAPGAERDTAAAPAPEPPAVVAQPTRPQVRPKPPRSTGPTVGQGTVSDKFATPPADPKPEPKKESTDRNAPLELAAGDEDMQPKGGFAESTSVAPQPAPDNKSVSRKPLPSIEGEDRAAKDSSVAQLVKQCEAAAAKNDCAAVRTIAQKIAKQDPSTYRLKVAKNAAVARCLEPPAPIEAAPTNAN
jgi:hypothetical protein